MTGQLSFHLILVDRIKPVIVLLISLALTGSFQKRTYACPFCPPVSSTLTEQYEGSPVVILSEWDSIQKTDEQYLTSFVYLKTVKGETKDFESKKIIKVDGDYQGNKGDLFLLFSDQEKTLSWIEIIPVSETSFQYILQAPGLESSTKVRLSYFMRFLEFPDSLIANDAFSEFAQASFEDVSSLIEKYPVQKIRKWVQDPETPVTRLGLYSLMLGLSGEKHDSEILKQQMKISNNEFHLGLDGLMAGYVLLTGNQGLEYLKKNYLSKKEASSSESYAVMKALRFLFQYAGDRIDSEKIKAAMRMMLDRSTMTEIVVIDLTRWKDWTLADQLMQIYNQPVHDNRQTRRAIITYLFLFQDEVKKKGSTKQNQMVDAFLAKAQKEHPRAYREAGRLLNR